MSSANIPSSKPIFGEGNPLPKPEVILHKNVLIRQWQWKKEELFHGFLNIGMNCFMNSVLQCLQYLPVWSNYLWFNHVGECLKDYSQCFACMLARATFDLQHKCEKSFEPTELFKNLQILSSEFVPGTMQDAHEFLICLFGKIQESVIKGKVDQYVEMTTAVGKIFGGFLRSQVACQECLTTSNTYEQYFDICLDIENCRTMRVALDRFFAVDEMGGEPWYQCEKCSRQTRAAKRYTVETLPEVLIIQLKRYDAFGRKLDQPFEFATHFALKKFASRRNEAAVLFTLFALVEHRGSDLRWGHYVSYVTDPSKCESDWFCIDDENVTRTTLKEATSRPAYLLFYIRM